MFPTLFKAFMALLSVALILGSAVAGPISKPNRSTSEKRSAYISYAGDGTVAQGWPDITEWETFAELAAYIDQQGNWPEETEDIRNGVFAVSQAAGVDPRFELVTIVQESKGQVRVPTTSVTNPHPGLMQSYGLFTSGTCKDVPAHQRCSTESMSQMTRDGTAPNLNGVDLQDLIARLGAKDVSKYYKATRMYISGVGSIPASGDLSSPANAATSSYSSDIANRLMGWVG